MSFFFFFSSRRRHTRCLSDWSSDVCSSDLEHYGFDKAGVYDPAGVGGTGVIYVLHDMTNPEAYGGLPKNPRIPWVVRSEERRVGKECKCRGGGEHGKKTREATSRGESSTRQ